MTINITNYFYDLYGVTHFFASVEEAMTSLRNNGNYGKVRVYQIVRKFYW